MLRLKINRMSSLLTYKRALFIVPTHNFYTTKSALQSQQDAPSSQKETKFDLKKPKSKYFYETIYEGPINNTMKGFKYIGNSLFLVALFAAPSIYFYGKAPILGSAFVTICGILPSYYTYSQTKSYVNLAQLRQSGSKNQRSITKESVMKLNTMGLYGQEVSTLVQLGDCEVFNHWLSPANLKAKRTILAEKDGKIVFGGAKTFFIEKGKLENNPVASGLWTLWKKNKD